MNAGVVVPAVLLEELATHPDVGRLTSLAPTFGGFNNLTFLATTAEGERVVVKATADDRKRADVRREQAMLLHLHDSDLPVARVLAAVEGEWTATVFAELPGLAGLHFVQSREVDELCARAKLLAALLRRVHATPAPRNDTATFDISGRYRVLADVVASNALGRTRSEQFIAALTAPILQRGVSLVHGDPGMHNTMWDDSIVGEKPTVHLSALIDWEWSGWGNPLSDLAWVWWTMRFRHLPSEVFAAFAESYGHLAFRMLGWNEENVRLVVRAHMASILLRKEAGSAAFDEWLVREERLALLSVPNF
jgi:aminoglycoside phosphotransferase (APT) family kinase protein